MKSVNIVDEKILELMTLPSALENCVSNCVILFNLKFRV